MATSDTKMTTDLELAEEIERQTKDRDAADIVLELDQWQQIIAALRRGHERIDAKMAELLVDTTWRKAVGQCVADVCGLDGKPLGKRCDRLFISRERFDEHIAPLIRQCERPPSGEMVEAYRKYRNATNAANYDAFVRVAFKFAAEAEGRKS